MSNKEGNKMLAFNIKKSMAEEFSDVCKQNDITMSQLLRMYIKQYIEKHKQENKEK